MVVVVVVAVAVQATATGEVTVGVVAAVVAVVLVSVVVARVLPPSPFPRWPRAMRQARFVSARTSLRVRPFYAWVTRVVSGGPIGRRGLVVVATAIVVTAAAIVVVLVSVAVVSDVVAVAIGDCASAGVRV